MRSSIACARCRRSKIKCINEGIDSVCRPCHQNNRECTYPSPTPNSSSTTKRVDHPADVKVEGEGEAKRARRRETDAGGRSNIRVEDDPLTRPPISLTLWREVYAVFKLHYSTDLPFVHEATFFDRIVEIQETGRRSRDTQMFLLGILSLTARFIPELVNYPFPDESGQKRPVVGGNPLKASEFYARALEARLDAVTLTRLSLDTVHALLMLASYYLGMNKLTHSWIYLGIATRMAYAMGLSRDDTSANVGRDDTISSEEAVKLGVRRKLPDGPPKTESQVFVNREIRRRTMWSCFMLDRYLSAGEARPQMGAESLHIRLPCSEEDFRFGTNAKPVFLHSQVEGSQSMDSMSDGNFMSIDTSPVLGIYVRLVDIWGYFAKWACNGGRRHEKYPPWDERSECFSLRKRLQEFRESLPIRLQFTSANLSAHAGGGASQAYTAIHALYFLCEMFLHREYVPYIAIKCPSPVGPLDEPTFPKDKYDIPEGFWEESAETLFMAARNITEIVRANSSRGLSIESPLMGFAIYTAAYTGLYAVHFPHMDVGGHMRDRDPPMDWESVWSGRGATGLATRALKEMSPRMIMARDWNLTIKNRHDYHLGIIRDHNRSLAALSSPGSQARLLSPSRKLSLREGGHGGGLEEYKLFEKAHKEFGSFEDEERHSTPTASERTESRASTGGPAVTPAIKAEAPSGHERTPNGRLGSESHWAAINHPPTSDERSDPPSYYNTTQEYPNSTSEQLRYPPYQMKGSTSNLQTSMPPPGAGPGPSFSRVDPPHLYSPSHPYHPASHRSSGYPAGESHTHRLIPQSEAGEVWTTSNGHVPTPHYLRPELRADYISPSLGRVMSGGAQVGGFGGGLNLDMWSDDGEEILNATPFMTPFWNQTNYGYVAGQQM